MGGGFFFCFEFCIAFYGAADKMKCNMIYTAIIWCIEMLINNQAITLFTILIIAQITHTAQSIISILLQLLQAPICFYRHSVDLYLMKAVFFRPAIFC